MKETYNLDSFEGEKTLMRFMVKVKKTDTCWIWRAAKTKEGYGLFSIRYKMRVAHRVSYIHFKGKIPVGLQMDHLCRNTSCVNPEHLEPVTAKENKRRSDILGRRKRGKYKVIR